MATLVDVLRYVRAIMCDRSLSALDRRVAFAIVDHVNETRGYAWPSLDQLATWTGANRRNVIRSVNSLEAGQWFAKVTKRGHGGGTQYHPNWKKGGDKTDFYGADEAVSIVAPAPPLDDPNSGASATFEGSKGDVQTTFEGAKGGVHATFKGGAGATQSHLSKSPSRDIYEPAAEIIEPSPSKSDDAFLAFWSSYPNQSGEEGAKREFWKLIRSKAATVPILIDAAKAYGQAVADREPQFIKAPANWLRDGHWRDQNMPPSSPARLAHATGSRVMDAARELFADLDDRERNGS
ncbi:helix-turn-helix domain-containing protein [Oleomonas cavernae]|uniref:Helix-turn-helix domain-containing protein n=1 Tax=Oleomonas cavernae TaxID=2320859 RepID=A0A418W9X8_9PROT|nr:helix-turn-helix domain-containing protein [Oleomonas cavernae]RJF86789.1 helix-turn-helix domain-containing protein [Oleomonas cavernae]